MNTEYAQLLKDPKWDAFRQRILQKADYRCECCGHTDKTLQVHHLYYDLSKKPWQYKDNHVACLCKECHKFSHKLLQQGWKPLTLDTLANISYYDEKEGELVVSRGYDFCSIIRDYKDDIITYDYEGLAFHVTSISELYKYTICVELPRGNGSVSGYSNGGFVYSELNDSIIYYKHTNENSLS